MVLRPVLTALFALVLAVHISAQKTPVFRNGTSTVSVFATVTDRNGTLVPDLDGQDFVVLDNGRPQRITVFNSGVQPIAIVVMLDMSGSMEQNVNRVRASAVQLFTRLLPDDKARVGIVGGDRPKFTMETFTSDVNELIRALWLDVEPGGGTPLWEGVDMAMAALRQPAGRRVVLVLSDGKDTGGWRTFGTDPLERLVSRAQAEDVMVYSIGLRGRVPMLTRVGGLPSGSSSASTTVWRVDTDPDPGLSMLAIDSGGRYFELQAEDDLSATFARVADELHRQYEIGYRVPSLDGKVHTIEVKVTRPGLTVRARRGYVAPKGTNGKRH